MTLAAEHVEQRRELGRFLNTFSRPDDELFPRVVRAAACGGGTTKVTGFAQLNLPPNFNAFRHAPRRIEIGSSATAFRR